VPLPRKRYIVTTTISATRWFSRGYPLMHRTPLVSGQPAAAFPASIQSRVHRQAVDVSNVPGDGEIFIAQGQTDDGMGRFMILCQPSRLANRLDRRKGNGCAICRP
jgi:hypothetical protein